MLGSKDNFILHYLSYLKDKVEWPFQIVFEIKFEVTNSQKHLTNLRMAGIASWRWFAELWDDRSDWKSLIVHAGLRHHSCISLSRCQRISNNSSQQSDGWVSTTRVHAPSLCNINYGYILSLSNIVTKFCWLTLAFVFLDQFTNKRKFILIIKFVLKYECCNNTFF